MVRVYQYGCLAPLTGLAEFENQLRLANRLWNKCVEIERAHRQAYLELTATDPQTAAANERVGTLQAELTILREGVKGKRKKARGNVEPADDARKRIAEIRAELHFAYSAAKQARQAAKERLKPFLHELESQRRAAVKAARQEAAASGLYWGSYNAVLAAYDTARQRAMKEGAELRFRRYTGEGGITIQVQGGMDTAAVFGTHGQLQIDPLPDNAFTHTSRGERRRLQRTSVRIRANSDECRSPVWVELPMVMHRPLPAGRIVGARLVRRKVATHWQYHVCITVDMPDELRVPANSNAVAIDLCWRQVAGGIRVAYLADHVCMLSSLAGLQGVAVNPKGDGAQVVLPDRLLDALRKCDELRSIRDGNFNQTRDELAAWLKTVAAPDWLQEHAATLSQWRSTARLAALTLAWRERRFEGDESMYVCVESWRKQDKHLLEWQENQREQAQLHRREIYRVLAARLAQTYGRVVLEDVDLRQLARQRAPEDGPKDMHEARHQRVLAAPSELRAEIERAAASAGVEVARINPAWTTQTCHVCGTLEKFDTERWVNHQCSHCQATWDQDENACRNLLLANERETAGKAG